MDKRKRMLALLCLMGGLLQAPAANAQAEVLVGLGARLLPVLIPMALSTIPMIPAFVSQMPRPHLPRRKSPAQDNQNAEAPTEAEAAAAAEAEKNARESEEAEALQREEEAKRREAQVVRRVKARDNSEWFLDDETEQVKAPPPARPRPIRQLARKIEGARATENVKGEVLSTPAKLELPQSNNQAIPKAENLESNQLAKPEASAAAPIIMMHVSE
ncbi:MAG: hypothetical protein K2X27_00855 [Candidatus Obscuribacterales bacterium]|nr:hypothetical protein [Candidatus Obscuribacterales bacterium]